MLIKRSFSLAGHRTSVALEAEFWERLGEIAASRGQKLSALIRDADAGRDPGRPLASVLRVLALVKEGQGAALDPPEPAALDRKT